MLSYHKWKMLNEQFGGPPLTLGLRTPNSIGVVGAVAPTEEEIAEDNLEEAKKKKKMLRDPQLDEPDPELGDELGGDIDDEADIEGDDECDCSCHDDEGDGEEMDIDGDGDPDIDPKKIMMCKKCKKSKKNCKKSSKKSAKKSAKKMTKEEEDWWSSVHDMSMGDIDTKNWDGMTEDSLLSPEDPNAGLTDEPGPGEVGYAPQGVVGGMR